MSLIRAFATVGGLTLVSRIAGFARDILMAAILGAGLIADAFFVALKLPNLFRRLFAEGAFTVAFVPIFAGALESEGPDSARVFAERALAVLLAILAPLSLLAVATMPWLMQALAPGFVADPTRFDLAVNFAQTTFPYLILMSAGALLGGVLNSLERFAPFAAAPILFNLALIAALVMSYAGLASPGPALALAVPAAGVLQLVFLAYAAAKAGMPLRLPLPRLTPRVRRLFRLMAPAALGAGVMQINLFIDIILASLLPSGAISYLYYADRLYQLPLAVIGIAIGTALLPVLARQVRALDQGGDPTVALDTQNRAVEYGMMLALPASAGLIALAGPIIATLFERGAFGPAETAATAWALAAYAVGIPAYVLVKVLATAFYARQDTTTPVRAAIVATVANAIISVSLILVLPPQWGHAGIALSTGATAWLNAGLLARALRRQALFSIDHRLAVRLPRLTVAAGGLLVALVLASFLLAEPLGSGTAVQVPLLGFLIVFAIILYFGIGHLVGALRIDEMLKLIRGRA